MIDRHDQNSKTKDYLTSIEECVSHEIRAHDYETLHEEEELEQLLLQNDQEDNSTSVLTQKDMNTSFPRRKLNLHQAEISEKTFSKNDLRRHRNKKKGPLDAGYNSEEVELLFEIEEGVISDSCNEAVEKKKHSHRKRFNIHQSKLKTTIWQKKHFLSCLVTIGLFNLLLLTLKLKYKSKSAQLNTKMSSNGTALFAPTTILISLDGFRPDFLSRGITPRLNAMREEGFSPVYMRPSFPSVTFPNHYTLVTGLHPESHGIVSNVFWDGYLKERFYYTKPDAMNKKWWGGEPIWVTAEKQGVKTAVHMWPGSEAHIMDIEPSYLDKFDFKTTMKEKSEKVLEFLDMEAHQDSSDQVMRPQLIAAYVPHVDADGHFYGPNTTEIRNTISGADNMVNEIYQGLEKRNLTDIVNIVVVSDHGMATTDIERMIQLDDLLDLSKIDHIDGWPLSGLHPKSGVDVDELYEELFQKAALNPNFDVYLRDKNMPERYHFSNNKRIAPIWIVPVTGWAITTKEEFDIRESKLKGLQYHPRGLHGYDNEHPLMHSIFIARGPAFPHIPSNRIKPFQNTEVYNIICHTLGLVPASNNGTLHLPLLPIDPQEPDFIHELPSDLEVDLVSTAPKDQDNTITSLPFKTASPKAVSSENQESTVESNSSNTSKFLTIDHDWIANKEDELWKWFMEKTAQIKSWYDKSLA
ncbi:putative pyrophosphatase/phosphodiesterase [Erysiphe neolycopersici]|uniref:Putative pyrophosphatase/phosphodiesterase n=1 Tax=Erysiphe neolycopersici TaxID=212602 RepID=A0A420HVK4_9PEZI|nr:putative pyrophosphatase/phosphodiesterase [Erysiphe neolycopersici]